MARLLSKRSFALFLWTLPGMAMKISQRSSFHHAEGKMAQEIQDGNVFQDRRINLHLPQSKVGSCATEIIYFPLEMV